MTTAKPMLLDRRDRSLLSWIGSRLFDRRAPELALSTTVEPIAETALPEVLGFAVPRQADRVPAPAVTTGEEIEAGRILAAADDRWRAPLAGRVAGVRSGADARGGKAGLTVLVEPAAQPGPALPSLDPQGASRDAIRQRLLALGAMTDDATPLPLLDRFPAEQRPGCLAVLAADREPWLSGSSQLLREHPEEALEATRLLSRLADFDRVVLLVLEPLRGCLEGLDTSGLEIETLPPVYPHTLAAPLRERFGPQTLVLGLQAALGALEAVRSGRPQSHRVLSVTGPGGRRLGNHRVPLGMRISDLLDRLGVSVGERDKVVLGGPLGGFAQFSLETSVDHGTSGVLVLGADEIRAYSDEPCINCGTCLDACPARLQAHHLARYAEFGLFDQLEQFGLDHCFECGLCAAVCPARRPLLQLIRLGKRELAGHGKVIS